MKASFTLLTAVALAGASAAQAQVVNDVIKPGKGSFAEYRQLTTTPAPAPVQATPPQAPVRAPQDVSASNRAVSPVLANEVAAVNAAAPVAAPVAPPPPQFVLTEGKSLHAELQNWASSQGWKLIWYPRKSWEVIGSADFSAKGDVVSATEEVVRIVRAEGKPIFLSVANGNRVMEISTTDIVEGENGEQ